MNEQVPSKAGCECGKPKNHCDPCSTEQRSSKDKLPLIEWVLERFENCVRIAKTKERPADRDGWLEDAAYFRELLVILNDRPTHEPGTAPTAWMRGHRNYSPGEPDDYDVECVYGDDPPDDSGKWIPLYRRPAQPPGDDATRLNWWFMNVLHVGGDEDDDEAGSDIEYEARLCRTPDEFRAMIDAAMGRTPTKGGEQP